MKTKMEVKGMTCKHCEQSVKGALEGLTGVKSVKVQLNTGEVVVSHDDVTLGDMREAVEDQGYDVIA